MKIRFVRRREHSVLPLERKIGERWMKEKTAVCGKNYSEHLNTFIG